MLNEILVALAVIFGLSLMFSGACLVLGLCIMGKSETLAAPESLIEEVQNYNNNFLGAYGMDDLYVHPRFHFNCRLGSPAIPTPGGTGIPVCPQIPGSGDIPVAETGSQPVRNSKSLSHSSAGGNTKGGSLSEPTVVGDLKEML